MRASMRKWWKRVVVQSTTWVVEFPQEHNGDCCLTSGWKKLVRHAILSPQENGRPRSTNKAQTLFELLTSQMNRKRQQYGFFLCSNQQQIDKAGIRLDHAGSQRANQRNWRNLADSIFHAALAVFDNGEYFQCECGTAISGVGERFPQTWITCDKKREGYEENWCKPVEGK